MNYEYPKDYTVDNAKSSNPELLEWILNQPADNEVEWTASAAINNPHTPSHAIAYVLKNYIKTGRDNWANRYAGQSQRTPP